MSSSKDMAYVVSTLLRGHKRKRPLTSCVPHPGLRLEDYRSESTSKHKTMDARTTIFESFVPSVEKALTGIAWEGRSCFLRWVHHFYKTLPFQAHFKMNQFQLLRASILNDASSAYKAKDRAV